MFPVELRMNVSSCDTRFFAKRSLEEVEEGRKEEENSLHAEKM
jgi:hypothetical protein